MILPIGYNKSIWPYQYPKGVLDADNYLTNPSLKVQQAFNSNKTLLPRSNFSVTEFKDGVPQFTYNASILSINVSHWQVECNYSRTVKFLSPEIFPNEFSTSVTRTSINHSYLADNFHDFSGEIKPVFDYWINTTGFSVDYTYIIGENVMSVLEEESIHLPDVGRFNAWKINMTFSPFLDPMTFWYSEDGLFLSLYSTFVSIFWYNLTTVEIAQLPDNYNGPILGQTSPRNDSHIPNGSVIDIQLYSPFGIGLINYHWDTLENQTSTVLQSIVPSESGSHDLYITVRDNIGITSYFYFSYFTDYSIPGIFPSNFVNNSHIRGLSHLLFLISQSNGSMIYNWDGDINTTISKNTSIVVPNSEEKHELNVFVVSSEGKWDMRRFIFTVDNSPPIISLQNLVNNSVIKGTVTFQTISLTEDCNLTFILDNETIRSIMVVANQSHETSIPNLDNGSYQLLILAIDEAQNSALTKIIFSIYISAFDWDWGVEANSPKTINFVNSTNDLWFILTLTSSVDQNFSLSIITEESENMEYAVEFICEEPEEIIFITLAIRLSSVSKKIPVYQWVRWDSVLNQWMNITTVYNEVSISWEATFEGYVPRFALLNTGMITKLKSITPGGGQIPAFEFIPALLSLITIYCVSNVRRKPRKPP